VCAELLHRSHAGCCRSSSSPCIRTTPKNQKEESKVVQANASRILPRPRMSTILLQAGGLCLKFFGIPNDARSVRFIGKSCCELTGSTGNVTHPVDLFEQVFVSLPTSKDFPPGHLSADVADVRETALGAQSQGNSDFGLRCSVGTWSRCGSRHPAA